MTEAHTNPPPAADTRTPPPLTDVKAGDVVAALTDLGLLRGYPDAATCDRAIAELTRLRAELAAREVAGDEAIRAAVGAAIDAFPGKLHSEQIDLVLAAVAPQIRAAERNRIMHAAEKRAAELFNSWDSLDPETRSPTRMQLERAANEVLAFAAAIRAGAGDAT